MDPRPRAGAAPRAWVSGQLPALSRTGQGLRRWEADTSGEQEVRTHWCKGIQATLGTAAGPPLCPAVVPDVHWVGDSVGCRATMGQGQGDRSSSISQEVPKVHAPPSSWPRPSSRVFSTAVCPFGSVHHCPGHLSSLSLPKLERHLSGS